MEARIAMILFRHREGRERCIVIRAIPASGPHLCGFHQITPIVRPPPRAGRKLIDALLCGLSVLGHVSLLILARVLPDRDPLTGRSFDPNQRSRFSAWDSYRAHADSGFVMQ